MSYYLRGSDGDFSGLGTIAAPAYEKCDPTDAACVARNQALNDAYGFAVEQAAMAQHLTDCLHSYPAATCHAQFDPGGIADSTANAGAPVQGYATLQAQTLANRSQISTSTPATVAAPSGGHVSFSSSRGGNALQVGDTWLVSITGASPNAPVTATVGSSTSSMGTTDGSGNFSLSGTARAQDVGTWNESWAVGGVPSGAFAFTVSAPSSQNGDIPTPVLPTVPVTLQTSGSAASSSTVIGGFDLSTIPTWGWLAAAGVAAFFMFGKGGR
jgi:hypothetical protein